jgi:hypothetical protein
MALEQGNTVWLVDGVTRIVLPRTAWGFLVWKSLIEMGHSVQRTDLDPNSLFRDDDELARKEVLLNATRL